MGSSLHALQFGQIQEELCKKKARWKSQLFAAFLACAAVLALAPASLCTAAPGLFGAGSDNAVHWIVLALCVVLGVVAAIVYKKKTGLKK